MSLSDDLRRQAYHLATREPRRPKQASLRRAVSAAYCALFHLLVDEATLMMFGGRRDRREELRAAAAARAAASLRQLRAEGIESALTTED